MLKKIDAVIVGSLARGIHTIESFEDDRIYSGLSLNDGYQYAWTCTCGQGQDDFRSKYQMEIGVDWHRKSHNE
jgi:hypothetical protein